MDTVGDYEFVKEDDSKFTVRVVDPTEDWVNNMKSLFDFEKIKYKLFLISFNISKDNLYKEKTLSLYSMDFLVLGVLMQKLYLLMKWE